MSSYFYKGILEKDSLVIYRYNEGDLLEFSLLKGYMESAEIIINKIKSHQDIGAPDDVLVYPLLNIYSCVIEFLLKVTIKKLEDHRLSVKCPFLKPADATKSVLLSHDISKLFSTVEKCINNSTVHPHQFTDLDLLKPIIEDFKFNSICVESTRYHHSRHGKIQLLYDEQKNLKIYKLHNDIVGAERALYSYINEEHMSLCALKCFTSQGLNRLKEILAISEEKESLFQLLPKTKEILNKRKDVPSGIVLARDIRDETLRGHSDKELEFYNQVRDLPLSEQNAVLKCLYLANRSIVNIGLEDNFNSNLASEKVYEYKHQYQRGLDNLRALIKYIEQFSSLF